MCTHHCWRMVGGCQLQLFFNNGGCQPLTLGMGCCICQWTVPSINGCCTLMATNPTITPLPFMWGNCPLASSTQACMLQFFQAYHSESVSGQVYRYLSHLSITRVTKAHLFSHTKGSLQPDGLPLHIWRVLTLVSGTQHSTLSVSTMLGLEWFIKPHIKAYNTPSNENFHFQVRQSLSEYLNMITSSLIPELCLPSVPP